MFFLEVNNRMKFLLYTTLIQVSAYFFQVKLLSCIFTSNIKFSGCFFSLTLLLLILLTGCFLYLFFSTNYVDLVFYISFFFNYSSFVLFLASAVTPSNEHCPAFFPPCLCSFTTASTIIFKIVNS